MTSLPPIRIILAKIGLDGHDRGVKVVARGLRDAGMEVIYAGLWQTPEAIVRTVADEDAKWLGLSLLSGAHMTLVPRVLQHLRQAGLQRVGLLVGGIIPEEDIPKLLQMGVARVFGPGTTLPDIAAFLRQQGEPAMPEGLFEHFRSGDRLALSHLLTLASRGEHIQQISTELPATQKRSRVVAVTGSGGVGKSTLIGKLIELLRKQGRTVAVLACDPQSPLTGGALLGDRFRMPARPDDDGVLIRSLAAQPGQGAIARHLNVMIQLLEVFGFDVILVETVGAGQGDTAVRDLVDVLVMLLQPETGDELQWEKAGLLEVADVVAIHKADLPGAEQVESQVRAALGLSGEPQASVVRVSSRSGEGIEQLWDTASRCPQKEPRQ